MNRVILFLATLLVCLRIGPATATPQVISLSCDPSGATDVTTCIRDWMDSAQVSGKDLYVPPGTYLYTGTVPLYSNVHMRCAGPGASVFRNGGGSGNLFLTTQSIEDVIIENCGFDAAGNETEYLAFISVNSPSAKRIHVRGNRFFDSTTSGTSKKQRQYILLTPCEDCWIENNRLSGGGRIKVGRPGQRLFIANNVVEHANDHAITVVDITGTLSRDIQIVDNVIVDPINIGIFFGADGETKNDPRMRAFEIQVKGNHVRGDWAAACIRATLPEHAERVHVINNICLKTPPIPTESEASGIDISRIAVPPSKFDSDIVKKGVQPRPARAREILIASNTVSAAPHRSLPKVEIKEGLLRNGGIKMTGRFQAVRILGNDVRDVGNVAIHLKNVDIQDALIADNLLSGGGLEILGSFTGKVAGNLVANSKGHGFGFVVQAPGEITTLVSGNAVWTASAPCVAFSGTGKHQVDLIGNTFIQCTGGAMSGNQAPRSIRLHNKGDAAPHAAPTRHLHATRSSVTFNLPGGGADRADVAVLGAARGDIASASFDAITSGEFQMSAHVTAADTVRVVITNPIAFPINLTGTLRVQVWKFE